MDLEEEIFRLAQTEYPDARRERYAPALDTLAAGVDSIDGLCRRLFAEAGFRGNTDDYYDPDNSYFNRVLERRLGIPITLCALMMLVGRRAGLTVEGIGMPTHFLARCGDRYVDAFDGGRIFGRDEANRRLVETGFGFQPPLLEAVSAREMIERMVHNLAGIYRQRGDEARLARLADFYRRHQTQ